MIELDYDAMHLELDDGVLNIWFRGTITAWEWILNFCAWPLLIRRPYKNMPQTWRVHWGFFKGYKKVQDRLYAFVDQHRHLIDKVSIRGYSRGGAMAYYCGEDLSFKYNGIHMYGTVTYGAPRGVDKKGVEVIDMRLPALIMVEYGNDAVTKIPWWFSRPGYILHRGPERKWWKLSGKDHNRYTFELV